MYFKSHDISLYYEKYGNDKENALVILPGWGETRKTFYYMIPELSKYKTIYIIDYPGFGKTKFPNHDLTIYHYTLLIKDFLEKEELVNPILLGHSFGGRIIILLLGYYHYPTEKAILMDSAGICHKKTMFQKLKSKCYRLLQKIGKILSSEKQKRWQEFLIRKFGSEDYKNLSSNMRKTFSQVVNEDLTPYLKEISQEVLLIWGEKDQATPLKDGQKMEKEMKNAALITIPNTSHFPYLEEINLVHQILISFLHS